MSIQTQRRLSQLQICVSSTSTLQKMDGLHEGYDEQVRAWKDRIEKSLKGKMTMYLLTLVLFTKVMST